MERQIKSISAEWKFYKEYSFIDFFENMASETGHVFRYLSAPINFYAFTMEE